MSSASDRASVRVALADRSYDIEIGDGILANVATFLISRRMCTHAVLIADESVRESFGKAVEESFQQAQIRTALLGVPAGESSKSNEQALRLWNELVNVGADRKSVVVAIGGGVTGDLAGFVAATFGRGLPFLQIPTTLLSQVDSSVGGKVGINLPAAKNMVGAFWQPCGVVIDTKTLTTLPRREYISGLAEVAKYGVILDSEFFQWLEKHKEAVLAREPAALTHIIRRSCELKASVVQQDEREETGLRAILNYGHTFAHAIETVAGYGQYLHGEAVSIGMACAARLSHRLGRVDSEFVRRQESLLVNLGLPIAIRGLSIDELLEAMQRDKKMEYGRLRFVLPRRLGLVELVADVTSDLVRSTWQEALAG